MRNCTVKFETSVLLRCTCAVIRRGCFLYRVGVNATVDFCGGSFLGMECNIWPWWVSGG